ncbi:MAG: hypothetical protein VW455_10720 [Nitrospinota bacterium]
MLTKNYNLMGGISERNKYEFEHLMRVLAEKIWGSFVGLTE